MDIHPALDTNEDFLSFTITDTWEQTEAFWQELFDSQSCCSDPNHKDYTDYRPQLDEPSGLTMVKLVIRHLPFKSRTYKYLDLSDTTVKEAIQKVLKFYENKTIRKNVGDHIFFEGFYVDKDAFLTISLGS